MQRELCNMNQLNLSDGIRSSYLIAKKKKSDNPSEMMLVIQTRKVVNRILMKGARTGIDHVTTCFFDTELVMVDMVCTSPETLVYLYISGKDSILNMFCFRGKDYKGEASKDRGDKILNMTGT